VFVIGAYRIAMATPAQIEHLAAIELAAARLLVGYAPEHVLRDTTDPVVLRDAARQGRLWVASRDGEPVGFAHIEMLAPDLAHLEELDVHPAHGRQGVGTALVRTVCDWARRGGFDRLSLTTFRAPRWNLPFYSRLGFVEVPRRDWRIELERVVAQETARGLDPAARAVMAWSPR
jgi:GNAT superfamily N-acetyltransferase